MPSAVIAVAAAVATAAVKTYVVSAVLSAILMVAINVAASALMRKSSKPISNGQELSLKLDPTMPRQVALGNTATGGSLVWAFTYTDNSKKPNRYLVRIIQLSDLPINNVIAVRNGAEYLTFAGNIHEGMYSSGNFLNKDNQPCMHIRVYRGSPTAVADANLINWSGGEWTTDHKGTNIAYAIVRYDNNSDAFPSGEPQLTFELEGAKLYDDRFDSSIPGGTGTQRLNDPSTWVFSNNASVITANVLRGLHSNGVLLCGAQAEARDLDVAMLQSAHAICAQLVSSAGPMVPRYRAGIMTNASESTATLLLDLQSAFDGKIIDRGGAITIRPGAIRTPVFHVTDDDIVWTEQKSWQPRSSLSEITNHIVGTFVSAEQGYKDTAFPTLSNSAWEAEDGGERFSASYSFKAVPYATQVQRITKRLFQSSRYQGTVAFVLPIWALELEQDDWFTMSSERWGFEDKTFIAQKVDIILTDQIYVAVYAKEIDPSVSEWDGAVDEKPRTDTTWASPPYELTNPDIDLAQYYSFDAVSLKEEFGVRIEIENFGDGSGLGANQVILEMSDDTSDPNNFWTVASLAAQDQVYTQVGLKPGTLYAYRVKTSDGQRTSTPTDWEYITTAETQVHLNDRLDLLEDTINDVQAQANADIAALNSQVAATQSAMDALELSVQQDIDEINTEIAGINPFTTPNLLDNGGFENGLVGWGGDTGWAFLATGNAGPFVYRTAPASGTFVLSKTVTVNAGSTYTLAADMQLLATSGVVYVDMQFMNDANTVLLDAPQTNVPAGTEFSIADTNRKLYKCTATAPAGTTKVLCRFVVSGVTGLTIAAVRRMKLELGDKATSFTSEASSYTAYTTAYSANGQLATLSSTVSTLGSTVSTQATSITGLQSAAANVTGNLLTNTDAGVDLSGWAQGGTMLTGVSFGRNLAGDSWRPTGESVLGIYQANGTSTGYQEITETISVVAGKYYELSSLVAAHRCVVQLIIQWWDASNVQVAVDSSSTLGPVTPGTTLADWPILYKRALAPTGAVKATCYLRKYSTTAGQADSHGMFCRPQFVQTTVDGASPVPYSPGSGKATLQTINGSLATMTTIVAASSNPNLLQNGGFENQLLGWTPEGTASGGWTSTIWAWGRYARNTTAWAGGSGVYGILRSTSVPCQAGVVFTATADADILANVTGAVAYIQLMWTTTGGPAYTDGPNRAVGTHSIAFDDTGASRDLFKVTGTAPANTTAVAVRLVVSAPAGVTISEMNWRQAKLEKGSIATPYSGEASAVQMYQAYSDLNGSYATLSSTVSSQGASISSLQTSMTTANGNIATLTNTLNASSSPNLMDNGGFENGLTGWVSNVSGWNIANNGTWGTYAYRQGDFTGTAYMFKDVSGIAPGWPYTITCDPNVTMSSGTYSLLWQIQWMNSSNAIISSLDGPSITGAGLGFRNDGVNRAAIKTTGTAPAGTVLARFVLYFTKNSGTMVEIDMRQVKLELGTIATPFSPEASIRSVYTAANTNTSSIATINSTLSTTNSNVSSLQSAMSTANGNIATLQQTAAVGSGNLLPNSSFSQSGWPAGWDWYSPTPGSYTEGPVRDLAGNDWRPGGNFGAGWGEHNWGLRQTNGNSGDWGQLHSQRVPVQGNKYYSFEVFVACHRANNGIKIEWYDAGNTFISAADAGTTGVGTGGTNINGWTNKYAKGQAPANAAFAVCVSYKSGTTSGGDSYMWICRPMLIEVKSTYVGPSAYTPSGDRAAVEVIQTAVNTQAGKLAAYWQVTAVAGGRAQLTVYADANGGGGVDITGNVQINGNLLVTGSVTGPNLASATIDYVKLAQSSKGQTLVRQPFGPGSGPYFGVTPGSFVTIDEWWMTFDYNCWLMYNWGFAYKVLSGSFTSSMDAEANFSIYINGNTANSYTYGAAASLVWANSDGGGVDRVPKTAAGSTLVAAGTHLCRLQVKQYNSEGTFLNGWIHAGLIWGAA